MAATCLRCAASDKQHLHLRGPAFFADADVGGYDVLDPWRFRQKGGSGLLPTTENKKIRVNSPSVCECLVLFLRPEKPSHSGVQQKKRLHNSFHLVQGINQANNKRQTGWRHLPSSCC